MRRLLSISIVLLFLPGCGDDEPKRNIRLGDLWPHEDGRQWTYQFRQTLWAGSNDSTGRYADSTDVPPAPTLTQIQAWLEQTERPAPISSTGHEWALRFDGQRTTQSGVVAQNLEEQIDGQPAEAPKTTGQSADPFLAVRPVFLRGGAWQSNDQWIGLYGDFDQRPTWRFLDRNLEPGSRFTVTMAASPSWRLTGWITKEGSDVPRPGLMTSPPVELVECVYLLEFGPWKPGTVYHPDGEYWRLDISYGRVIYAPGVGPVDMVERLFLFSGDGDGYGLVENSAELIRVDPGPVP